MDPLSQLAMMGVGLALNLIGGQQSSSGASQYNAAQMGIFNTETKINAQRRAFMELDYRRKSVENLRNVQNARAVALAGATAQGAQFGSGLQGGFAQVSAEGAWNQLNLSQGVEVGRNIFGLDDKLNQYKMQAANAQMSMQQGSGMTSLGTSLMGAAPAFGKLMSGTGGLFGGSGSGNITGANPAGNLGGLY